jgi:hypothetical protein
LASIGLTPLSEFLPDKGLDGVVKPLRAKERLVICDQARGQSGPKIVARTKATWKGGKSRERFCDGCNAFIGRCESNCAVTHVMVWNCVWNGANGFPLKLKGENSLKNPENGRLVAFCRF